MWWFGVEIKLSLTQNIFLFSSKRSKTKYIVCRKWYRDCSFWNSCFFLFSHTRSLHLKYVEINKSTAILHLNTLRNEMNNLPISLLEQTKKHIKPNEFRFWEFLFHCWCCCWLVLEKRIRGKINNKFCFQMSFSLTLMTFEFLFFCCVWFGDFYQIKINIQHF